VEAEGDHEEDEEVGVDEGPLSERVKPLERAGAHLGSEDEGVVGEGHGPAEKHEEDLVTRGG
jgi:hypothetical protein|tara:strand:+ start:345 stop:530 length:186 start_codon:yes stop_codon:yes gene_type:complete